MRLLTSGEVRAKCAVLLRELFIGAILARSSASLHIRVLFLSDHSTHDDALTISIAYTVIVTMATPSASWWR